MLYEVKITISKEVKNYFTDMKFEQFKIKIKGDYPLYFSDLEIIKFKKLNDKQFINSIIDRKAINKMYKKIVVDNRFIKHTNIINRKDIELLFKCYFKGDYTEIFKTNLYINHGWLYCRLLSFMYEPVEKLRYENNIKYL